MTDINNSYEALDRSLKKVGILLIDDKGHLRGGRSEQCVDLLRKICLHTSSVVAKQMLLRGCPTHAPDKRLIAAAFELARDKAKYSPSITVDQFLKEGFASHKLAVLLKLSIYLPEADKSFVKSQAPKQMYVVPDGTTKKDKKSKRNDTVGNSPYSQQPEGGDGIGDDEEEDDEEVEEDGIGHDVQSEIDDKVGPSGVPTVSSSPAAEIVETSMWPQTDFIKKHILDQKLAATAGKRTLHRDGSKSPSTAGTSPGIPRPSSVVQQYRRPVSAPRSGLRNSSSSGSVGSRGGDIGGSVTATYNNLSNTKRFLQRGGGTGGGAYNGPATGADISNATNATSSRSHSRPRHPNSSSRGLASTSSTSTYDRDMDRNGGSYHPNPLTGTSMVGVFTCDADEKAVAMQAIQALRQQRLEQLQQQEEEGGGGGGGEEEDEVITAHGARTLAPSPYSQEHEGEAKESSIPDLTQLATTSSTAAAGDVEDEGFREYGNSGQRDLLSDLANDSALYHESDLHVPPKQALPISKSPANSDKPASPRRSGSGSTSSSEIKAIIEEIVGMKLTHALANEEDGSHASALSEMIERKINMAVEAKVAAAVEEITTKYDFIINKLVSAVDAEFTLLNNKLSMQQQSSQQSSQSPPPPPLPPHAYSLQQSLESPDQPLF